MKSRGRKYRHRVTIVGEVFTDDGMGGNASSGKTATTTDIATVWAKVTPKSGDEYPQSDQVSAEVTHEVEMRYRQLSPKNRLKYEGRVLEISRVININEMDKELKVLCIEVVN